VEDARRRDIPKESIADDISMAGLSIQERKEKIKALKDSSPTISKKLKKMLHNLNSWWHF
jgi:hypothetical protein